MRDADRRADESLAARILVLDGAMGTMLLGGGFSGALDRLVIAAPDAVRRVHLAYLAAGCDIITTNTFTSTAYDLNLQASRLAGAARDEWTARSVETDRLVAGSIGPVGSREDYRRQVQGLVDGGCDLLLLETVTDSAIAREALAAIDDVSQAVGRRPPVMISAAIAAGSGRLMSGETIDAFWDAVAAARPWSVGLNCSSGARALAPHLVALAQLADCRISFHPSAGLPDASGRYAEQPSDTATVVADLAARGVLTVAGGCCGTTPAHIRGVAAAVRGCVPRGPKVLPK